MREVYNITDLVSRDVLDAGAEKPALLAVIGHPIAHSASPRMHQAALDAEGIHARYIRLDVQPGQVGEVFEKMRRLGFRGCNVTVPHKLEAMDFCEVSPQAKALGAVNTICFDAGLTHGFNTDGPGFMNAIQDDFGVPLSSLKVLIAGAGGGAGQAIATQCFMENVAKLVLVNRSLDKLEALIRRANVYGTETTWSTLGFDDADLEAQCKECDLIVNTSSVGLKPEDPAILPAECLAAYHLVYDTIYQPPRTALWALAAANGCRVSNGRSMLIHQGALAFQHWYPGTNPLAVMKLAMAH
jgi:shikimate dehydrogenase